MRIAIVTESFPPDVNGVAHSVVRVAEHLRAPRPPAAGHRARSPPSARAARDRRVPYPVVRMPVAADARLPAASGSACPARALTERAASRTRPTSSTWPARSCSARGARAGRRACGLPTVAVYQTDVAGVRPRVPGRAGARRAAWRWLRAHPQRRRPHPRAVHAPRPPRWSRTASAGCGCGGAASTPSGSTRRSATTRLRRALAPNGEVLVGYVGRLAVEKRVDLLADACRLPGVRVVVVGDGPARRTLRRGAARRGLPRRAARRAARPALRQPRRLRPHRTVRDVRPDRAGGAGQRGAGGGAGRRRAARPGRRPGVTGDAGAAAATAPRSPRRWPSWPPTASCAAAYGPAARGEVAARTWAAVGDELIAHYIDVTTPRVPLEHRAPTAADHRAPTAV